MSHSQMIHEIEGIEAAGWVRDAATGWWKHHRVGGLHSLKSAIKITAQWAA